MGISNIVDVAKETSTTTGTVDLVLGGAVPGYFALGDLLVENAVFSYRVDNVTNPSDQPEWEEGTGSLVAGSLVRTTVTNSSQADAKVNFSAGTKHVRVEVTLQDFVTNAVAKALLP